MGGSKKYKNNTKKYRKKCIYIHNLTRRKDISFEGKVDYFGGGLIILIPKKK